MNRRSFFKTLSSAVVGCYLAVNVKLVDGAREVKKTVQTVFKINPDYLSAPYEIAFYVGDITEKPGSTLFEGKSYTPIIYKRHEQKPEGCIDDLYPIRLDENKKHVAPIIEDII